MAEGKSNSALAFFKDMPPLFKGIIALIIIIILVIVAYLIYKKVKTTIANKDLGKTANDAGDEYSRLKNSGQKLSNPLIAYQQTANSIAMNLDGCETLSTELKVIDDITKVVKNPIDWYFLVKTFAVKDIADCGSFGATKTSYALPELLKDQLDTSGIYAGVGGGIGSGVTARSSNLLEGYLSKIGVTL